MVVVLDDYYAVLHGEELREALGHPVTQSRRRSMTGVLPNVRQRT